MIDSPLPPPHLMVMPVRPEPVPPGQATLRPTPTPNGAEAGARHPLTDHQRDDTKAARADAPKAREEDPRVQAREDTFDNSRAPREESRAAPGQIGGTLDVYA
jgi:hypothetical protein